MVDLKEMEWNYFFFNSPMSHTKREFITWLNGFNARRKDITIDKWTFGNDVNFTALSIYKCEDFFKKGKLDISTHKKPSNKIYETVGSKKGH